MPNRSFPVVFSSLLVSSMGVAPLAAQESKALLHAPLAVLPIDSAPFQRLGDFDGDGDLDAVGTRLHEDGSTTRVQVWENVDGAFAQVFSQQRFLGGQVGGAQRSHAVAVGDLDADGRDDFVVVGTGAAIRYQSAPGWQFTETILPLSMTSRGSRAAAIGDFDGDGTGDIAVTADRYDSWSSGFDVFFGNGAVLSTTVPTGWRAGLSLQPIDFDGDGVLDLLHADKDTPTAYVYSLLGGQLVQLQVLTTTLDYIGDTPWLWMAGDIDNDLDVDVVCFKPELGTSGIPRYELFRRTGPATLVAEPLAIGGPAEYLADIDGDGDLDGVCCGGGQASYDWPLLDFPSTFELSENRGGGDFARAWAFPNAGSESMAGAVDVDGDGDVELVAGRAVFYGDGPWNEQPMPRAGGADATRFLRPGDLSDFDGDGDVDYDYWGANDGTGVCVQVPYQPLATVPGYLLSAPITIDVDGDGARDRVSRLYQATIIPTFVGMAWERNNGAGRYSYAGPCSDPGVLIGFPMSGGVDTRRRADLDGDGDEDVFVEGGVIHWNDNGVYSAPSAALPGALNLDAVGDLDGDGLPELITTGWLGAQCQIWKGTGLPGAGFVEALVIGDFAHEPCATAIGDLDDDGDVDFVRPGANGEPVLFVNETPPGGALAFTQHVLAGIAVDLTSTSGSTASPVRPTIALADFDLDGRTDLALGRLEGETNTGAVLRRVAWSNPPTLADYEVLRQVFVNGLAVDIDGDGVTDVMGSYGVRSRYYSRVAAGRRVQRHAGVAGEGGSVPVLGASGPYRVGETELVRLTGVAGPSIAVLGLSLGEAQLVDVPLPGLTLRVDPATTIVGTLGIYGSGDGIGAARAELPIQLPGGVQGWSFYLQAFVLDAAAASGFSQSNLLVKTIGG